MSKHEVKTKTVTAKILDMEVSFVFLDSFVKDPIREENHYLGENIFASVHNFGLDSAAKLYKRSLLIEKCQRAI